MGTHTPLPFRAHDVIRLLGIKTTSSGNELIGNCPLSGCPNPHRHLYVNTITDKVCCARCGYKGNTMTLYAEVMGITYKEAYRDIQEKLGMTNWQDQLPAIEEKEKKLKELNQMPLADIKKRDRIYRMLLNNLTLSDKHCEDLLGRGFDLSYLLLKDYKTMPQFYREDIASHLTKFESLHGIPGFYINPKGNWTIVNAGQGFYIPVKDMHNRIQAMQYRINNNALVYEKGKPKRKYRWLSSKLFKNGCGTRGFIHWVCNFRWEKEKWIPMLNEEKSFALIEGPLKADLFFQFTSQPSIAIPGVNALKMLQEALEQLKKLGVIKIYNCLDMDYLKNKNVQDASIKIEAMIHSMGFDYARPVWDPKYNGIDEYYAYKLGVSNR